MDCCNTITFQTILNSIEDAKIVYIKRFIEEAGVAQFTIAEKSLKRLYKIAKKLLRLFNVEIRYRKELTKFYYFGEEKRFCLDFLVYCLANRDRLYFDTSQFLLEDRKEISKFIRNQILGAFCDYVNKDEIFDAEDFVYIKKYNVMLQNIQKRRKYYHLNWTGKDYFLPINHFGPAVFYHKYGLYVIPKVTDMVAGRDIIDAGAYVGDSALILNELKPRKIYAFEPVKKNLDLLKKTIEFNELRNVIAVEKALSSCKEKLSIQPKDAGSFITDIGSQEITAISIDDFANKSQLDVGLIKMNIEGYEYKALLGAENTIKNKKPALIVSLYHNGQSFFEIPSLLKKWVPEYMLRFLNLNRGHPIWEKVLVAYCNIS